MVFLTMTSSIVEALQSVLEIEGAQPICDSEPEDVSEQATKASVSSEPSLVEAAVGKPISHGQILYLWKQLKSQGHSKYSLEGLLQGATVYIPPPPPKPEPVRIPLALRTPLRYLCSAGLQCSYSR